MALGVKGSTKVAVDMGAWFYMWNATPDDYDGIADELGVIYVDGNDEQKDKPFLKGVNNEKPVKVRLTYGKLTDGFVPGGETKLTPEGSCTRMGSPVKLGSISRGKGINELIGKTIKVTPRGSKTVSKTIISATRIS